MVLSDVKHPAPLEAQLILRPKAAGTAALLPHRRALGRDPGAARRGTARRCCGERGAGLNFLPGLKAGPSPPILITSPAAFAVVPTPASSLAARRNTEGFIAQRETPGHVRTLRFLLFDRINN
jgi:hypothetical protein